MNGTIAPPKAAGRRPSPKTAERPMLRELGRLGLYGALGFAGGCVRLPGNCAPAGLALTACSGCGAEGLCCLLGAAAGYALKGGLAGAIRYEAALLLLFTVSFVLCGTPAMEKRWFMPASAAVVTAITGSLCYFEEYSPLQTTVKLLAEVALSALGTLSFDAAMNRERCGSEREDRARRRGRAVLGCCVIMALCGWELRRGLTPGRSVTLAAMLLCACCREDAAGLNFAAALGLSAELGMGELNGWGGFALLGVMAAESVRQRGRKTYAAVFSVVFLTTLFWWDRERLPVYALELSAALAVFLLLPERALRALRSRFPRLTAVSGEWRSCAAGRTERLSDAFEGLYELLRQNAESGESDENAANVYDRAAEAVCRDCPGKQQCWHKEYIDTLTMLNDATLAVRRRGKLEKEDLSERFRERCLSPDAFLAAVNGEWRAMTYRRRLRAKLSENRTAAFGQYRFLSAVLRQVAQELRFGGEEDEFVTGQLERCLRSADCPGEAAAFRDASGRLRVAVRGEAAALGREKDGLARLSRAAGVKLCPAEEQDGDTAVLLEETPYRSVVGIAALQKEGEAVSGDRATFFRTEQGVLCVLLSDGMGSGESAERESICTVRILESFLRAGVEPATAMQILNSVMLLKNGEEWGYATVDLMCVDLFTGAVDFYKYGAAPSYLKSGRTVRRVKGISLAAGILMGEGELPDVIHMELKEGGFALVASDGVVSPERDGQLRERLMNYEGTDPQELAREILQEAAADGSEDDMTVLCVYLEAGA